MIINWLINNFRNRPDTEAIIFEDRVYNYSEILNMYEYSLDYFKKADLRPGEAVAIDCDYSPIICAAIFALIANRNIIVLLSSKSSEGQKEELMQLAGCSKRLIVKNESLTLENHNYVVTNILLEKLIEEGKPGLVLFTSGSTGKQKGGVHDLTKLLQKYKTTKGPNRILAFLHLDHVGGINTILHTLASCGTVITCKSRRPEDVCQIIQEHKVEILPTSPTFLNLLLVSESFRHYDLSSLKIITYGTEVMPETTLKRLVELLPNVKFKQTYGLSEVGILRTRSESSDSLWVKIGGEGYQTKVVDGILYIKAESAILGYLNAPNPFDEEGWFNTQDQVLVKGEYVKILGRKSEIINVGGEKVYPVEIENIIMQVPNIKNVVVIGAPNPLLGEVVTAKVNVINSESAMSVKDRIRRFCAEKLEPYKIPVKVEVTNDELFNYRFKNVRR
ncbi:long-chain fatty acid--CoA ligase [Paenibacillus woosongensis]|uniref:long-chain fatty acid--CoA ligase n=1 Tax=Paenibacillus woosongensis TaxID=307580 RepID=UPI0018C26551|nr:fatty acid--CoA ligase family protein [Paenibacillus woosongensis]